MKLIFPIVFNLAFIAFWAWTFWNARRTGRLYLRGVTVRRDKSPRAFAVAFCLYSIATAGLSALVTFTTALEVNRHIVCHDRGTPKACADVTFKAIAARIPG